jgi:hypothetical protein
VHEHLHPAGSAVREQVRVVRPCAAEDFDRPAQRRVLARAHLQWLHREPHRIDADHISSSRSQAAHSAAQPTGQLIDTLAPH